MSELFCIKRDDTDVPEYMRKLRNDKGTWDVTLVGSDGGIVQAHKNVLLLNSDYIREVSSLVLFEILGMRKKIK